MDRDQAAGAESAATLGPGAVARQGHAAQIDLAGRLERQRGVLLDPAHSLGRLGHGGRHHRTACGGLAHEGDAAHSINGDARAGSARGARQRIETAGGGDFHAPAGVVGAGRCGGLQQQIAGGHEGRVDQDALAGAHRQVGVVDGPDQATARAVVATGDHPAVDLHILAALQHDVGRAALGIQLRGRVDVEAGASTVVAQQVGSVGGDAAEQGDGARYGGLALPVGEGIGLDEQVRARAHQVDGAADDGRVLDLDAQVGVGLQRGQRSGHQEAKAALAGQGMRLAQLQLLDHAVVIGVRGVDHEELLRVELVGHQPAIGLDRVAPAPGHVLVEVVAALAFDEDLAYRFESCAGLVIDRSKVSRIAGGGHHPRLLGSGHGNKAGGGAGHRDLAPDHVGVDVVAGGAFLESGAVLAGAGVEEHRPAPAAVAFVGQDHILLGRRQIGKGQAVHWHLHIAPIQRGLGRVAAVQIGDRKHHARRRISGRRIDEDCAGDAGKAQLGQHHVLLGRAQAHKAGCAGRRGHAAPVHRGQIEVGRAKAGDHTLLGVGIRVDPVRALIQGVAQGRGHHLLLSGAQRLEAGPGSRCTDRAPNDLVVAVVGERPLGEVLHHLLAGRGVVVEVVLDRIDQRGLGPQVRAGPDLGRAVDEGGHDGALRRIELGAGRVNLRPLHIIERIFIAHVPGLARHGVVVEDIAQVLGHHQLLRAGERGEARLRCGRGNACGGPVHQRIAVVRRQALRQGGLDLQRAVGRLARQHLAVVAGVAGGVGNSGAQCETAAGGGAQRAGGRVVPERGPAGGLVVGIDRGGIGLVAQLGGHQLLLRRGEGSKWREVRQRLDHQVVQARDLQRGAADQAAQRRVQLRVAQGGHGRSDLAGVGERCRRLARYGFNGAAWQRIKIVGAREDRLAGVDGHGAGRGQGAGDAQLAGGGQRQLGTSATEHGRDAVKARARDDRASTEQVHVGIGAQVHHRGCARGLHGGATAQREAAGRVNQDLGTRSLGIHAAGADHRAGRLDQDLGVGRRDIEGAAGRDRQAQRLGTGAHIAALNLGRCDVQVDQALGDQPATHIGLLAHIEVQAERAQAGIGHALRGLEIERPHLQQAAVGGDGR